MRICIVKKQYLCLLIALAAFGTYAGASKVTEGIAFSVNGIDIPIMVLTPEVGSGPFPVIYHVHGGGWNGGTETEVPPAALPPESRFLSDELGLIYVGLAYRCKAQGNFQGAMANLRASIKWFEVRADEYNVDIARVGLSGGSADTPLSSLLAQEMPGCKTYVGLFGVYDFLNNKESLFPNEEACANYGLATESQKHKAPAFQNIRQNHPATLLFHGKKDILTHSSQSIRFAEQLKKQGADAEVVIYANVNHGYFNPRYPAEFKDTALRIARLYAEHLKLDSSVLEDLGPKIDKMVAGFFPLNKIKPEFLLGEWKGRNEKLSFYDDNTGVLTNPNRKSRPFTYEIGPGMITVHEPREHTVFYMQRNQRAVYKIITDDVRRTGQRFHFTRQKK